MTILDRTFKQWIENKDPLQARINIFEKIRDIPYAVVPELIDYDRYVDILKIGKGSCSPKHFLLCEMFQRLGLLVLFVVYPYRRDENPEILEKYSIRFKEMVQTLPIGHHIACKVEINGRLVLVDATLDLPLQKAGMTVNVNWDGVSDTLLPVTPYGEEEWYHPFEAHLMRAHVDAQMLAFYKELNVFLDWVRQL
jgi:hypothetical protein